MDRYVPGTSPPPPRRRPGPSRRERRHGACSRPRSLPLSQTPPQFRGDRIKLKALGRDGISIDRETIDLRYVEQLADGEQSAALGWCMVYAQRRLMDGRRTLRQIVDELDRLMEEQGLPALCCSPPPASPFWPAPAVRRSSPVLTAAASWTCCDRLVPAGPTPPSRWGHWPTTQRRPSPGRSGGGRLYGRRCQRGTAWRIDCLGPRPEGGNTNGYYKF